MGRVGMDASAIIYIAEVFVERPPGTRPTGTRDESDDAEEITKPCGRKSLIFMMPPCEFLK